MPTPALLRELERALPESINAADLAGFSHISNTQLYREFYSITGHTVAEYIRRRRLSNALALIKTSQLALVDIAHQCGFSSQQALNRAVKQTVGMPPLAYQKSDVYYFFPPYAGQALFPVSVKPESIPATQCLKYYDAKYKGIEDRALAWLLESRSGYRGRIFGRNGKQLGAKSCYELYIESKEVDHPAMNTLFATTVVQNEEPKINVAWDYLYLTWLAGSMFERTEQPYFEEYILKKGQPVKLKLYLPIQKRTDTANITLELNPGLHFVVASAKSEKAASRAVMDYLSANYPYVIQNANEFYFQRNGNDFTCGVRVNAPLGEYTRSLKPGHYLVLHSHVMGDYDALCERLLFFAEGNGMTALCEECFAAYDIRNGYANPGMKVYCQVKLSQNNEKLVQIDNTKPRLM